MLKKATFLFALKVLFFSQFIFSQSFFEVPLKQQIENATLVVEGKVTHKQCFWNEAHTMIYTVNTIEIYKTFKGSSTRNANVVTTGGRIGLDAIEASHSLSLKIGDVGLFTLCDSKTKLDGSYKDSRDMFDAYSANQGFYVYDVLNNTATNVFKMRKDIEQSLYKEIMFLTGERFSTVKGFEVSDRVQTQTLKAIVPEGISFSPSVISAGTQSTLTISGRGFGDAPGIVGFRNADNGGQSFVDAVSNEILSWSDTQIRVNVTANAGTGNIRITTTGGISAESSSILTVNFSQLNASSGREAFLLQHYNDNGTGGYTFELAPGFFNDTDNPGARAIFENALEIWRCKTGVNWVISDQPSQDTSRQGDGNVVTFDGGGFEALPAGGLGRTFTFRRGINCPSGEQWFVVGIDIIFNRDINWYFGVGAIRNNQIDFESTALHELGHAHLLDHVIDEGSLMHFRSTFGPSSISRTISSNLIEGANNVHFRSTTNQICPSDLRVGLMTSFTGDCTLNTEDISILDGLELFPNPAKDEVFISRNSTTANSNIDATLYDLSGRRVMLKKLNAGSRISRMSLDNLEAGVYLLSLTDGFNTGTKKLIIE